MGKPDFFCTIGNTWAIANVYNNDAKKQQECKIALSGVKHTVCDACALYKNRVR